MIGEHRGAFEYDWRSRFHLPLCEVGGRMTWGEAIRLTRVLANDPASMVAAALAGWKYPFPREAAILADLFDVQLASKSAKRPKPYPRPWPDGTTDKKHYGDTGGRTRAEVVAILNAHGHALSA